MCLSQLSGSAQAEKGKQNVLDAEDPQINFDWVYLTTAISLLRALKAIFNISSDDGKTSLQTSCLYFRNGKLDMYEGEEQANEN